MGDPWRYIDLGPLDAFQTNAQMPVFSRLVRSEGRPLMTTSVWGATHLNVGWFDDVDSTLDLDACRRLGIQVIRRPIYGGGTAFYDKLCASTWSWLLPKAAAGEAHDDLDTELRRFQPIVLDALEHIGLGEVQLEGSSDLRWHGRKIGAVTAQDVVACDSVGGFLNIKPPNLDLYLQVVRVPDDKFKDKVVKDMREYVVTASEIAGRDITYEDWRDALVAAVGDAGIALDRRPLNDSERAGVDSVAAKIGSDAYIRRVSSERFRATAPLGTRVGFGNEKGRKLCRAGVAVAGDGTIVAAMMAGDMHVGPPDTMDRIAAALVGADSNDPSAVRARIAGIFEGADVHQPDALMGVTTTDLALAVSKAIANANLATAESP
jgi:lipoate-protein ligase A